MYLPVNTRDEGNPILAILGGMSETFFFFFCILLTCMQLLHIMCVYI